MLAKVGIKGKVCKIVGKKAENQGEINFAKIRKGMQTNVKVCKIIQTCKNNLPNNVIFGDSPAVQK